MNKTIIFISGFGVPQFVAQSRFVWNKPFWSDYQCLWLPSLTPTSDKMVERELDHLEDLMAQHPGATLAGHSLGGWWAANLALRPQVVIKKMVLWTPLCDTSSYPIFNVTPRYYPPYQVNHNLPLHGPERVLIVSAEHDLIVPCDQHAFPLFMCFLCQQYKLFGGHFYQTNHQARLSYMKDWIECQ